MLFDYDYFSFHAMLRFTSVIPNVSHESKIDQCDRRGRGGGEGFCIEYRI